jgi:hypothetical protein
VTSDVQEMDREILSAVFASRVTLAKKTLAEAIADATEEHRRAIEWVQSPAKKEGSFLWMCLEFDYEPDAVRRAIQERRR